MRMSIPVLLLLLLPAVVTTSAQTILIDYDDGVSGNGIHEASLRNGGFEDADGSDFASTPYWESYFAEGAGEDPVRSDLVRTGALRAQTSGWIGTGIRAQPSQIIPLADWTIAVDDRFVLSCWVKQGAGMDPLDMVQMIIDVVDGAGAPVLQDGTSQLVQRNFPLIENGSWSLITAVTPAIPVGSAHLGHRIRLRILAGADRDEWVIVDDVTLTAYNGPTFPAPTLPARPNIVVFYADDVGLGDVSCYGSGIVPTPRIDSLATAGLRFTDGHSPASTCTPSRYSMLTGEYAWRTPGTGIASGVSKLLIRPGSVTLPSMMRQAGYATAAIGKWHLGLGSTTTDFNADPIAPGPREIGFDHFYGIPATNDRVPCVYLEDSHIVNYDPADPLLVSYGGKVGDEPTGRDNPELLTYYTAGNQHSDTIINGIGRIGYMDGVVAARWRDEDHADIFVDKAKTFMTTHLSSGTPFFLYMATPDIHVPRAPHERFQGQSLHGWRGDAILEMDWTVGAILDYLADPNEDGDTSDSIVDNTLFVFTSDNGPVGDDGYNDGSESRGTTEFADGHDSNGVYTGGKYSIREGGTRVPFLVQWPGTIPAGRSSDALVSATDFMATFAALTGQSLPTDAGPDSENILPALLGQAPDARRVLITQNNNQNPKGVRRDSWKYFSNNAALYNLGNDPDESSNVAGSNMGVRDELAGILTDVAATPMVSPMLGWWPLDEAAGTEARDVSGLQLHATLTGNPTWGSDAGRPFLQFDGLDDAAAVSDLPTLGGDFSLATWARSAAATWTPSGALLSRRPQFALVPVAGTRQLQFVVYADPTTPQILTVDLGASAGFELATWHHYGATYEAATGTATVYVDGIEAATTSFVPGSAQASSATLYLGADTPSGHWTGDLSDTRVYGVLLTPQRMVNTASGRLDDADADQILSDWEHRYGLDPFDASDAGEDADGDELSNVDEFNAGSSPIDPNNGAGGLLAAWPLDETTGSTAPDASGHGYDGTLINSPVWTTGPGRQYLAFNGVNQYVDVTGLPSLTSQVTAACWARSQTATWNIAGTLVSRRPQFMLHPWLNSTRLSFIVFSAGGSEIGAEVTLSTIPGFHLTDWHHYAGTYDAGTGQIHLYVDGILRATRAISPSLLANVTGSLHLGRDVGRSRYLNGMIDEARVFDDALSASEIMALTAGFDDDEDGLYDDFERRLIEADPADGYVTLADVLPTDDPDGDGSDNAGEAIAGTDPLSAGDTFTIIRTRVHENEGSRSLVVTVDGRADRTYTLFECASLGDTWVPVESVGPLADDQWVDLSRHELPAVRTSFAIGVTYTP